MDRIAKKAEYLQRQYRVLASNGHTHNEIKDQLHKLNRVSEPALTDQAVDELVWAAEYYNDPIVEAIVND